MEGWGVSADLPPAAPQLKAAPPSQEDQIRQLEDRRSMETRQELERIRDMGMVDDLKTRLNAKLGRNLYRKLNTGPLDKAFSRSVSRTGSLKGKNVAEGNYHRRMSSDSGLLQAREQFGTQETRRREQQQELAAIEEIGLLRSSTGELGRVRNHIRNHIHDHIARMSNHRLTIKPLGERQVEQSKSSVLITSVEDTEKKARELYRQQSKVVIDGFMQTQTYKQRVLERLSEAEMQLISSSLRRKKRKRSSGGSYKGLKGMSSQPPQTSNIFEVPPVPSPTASSAPGAPPVPPHPLPAAPQTSDASRVPPVPPYPLPMIPQASSVSQVPPVPPHPLPTVPPTSDASRVPPVPPYLIPHASDASRVPPVPPHPLPTVPLTSDASRVPLVLPHPLPTIPYTSNVSRVPPVPPHPLPTIPLTSDASKLPPAPLTSPEVPDSLLSESDSSPLVQDSSVTIPNSTSSIVSPLRSNTSPPVLGSPPSPPPAPTIHSAPPHLILAPSTLSSSEESVMLEDGVVLLAHLESVEKDCVKSVPNLNSGSKKNSAWNGDSHSTCVANGMHDSNTQQRYSGGDEEDDAFCPVVNGSLVGHSTDGGEESYGLTEGHSAGEDGGEVAYDLVERYSANPQNSGTLSSARFGAVTGVSFVGGVFGGMPVGKAPGRDNYQVIDLYPEAPESNGNSGGVVCDGDSASDEEAASGQAPEESTDECHDANETEHQVMKTKSGFKSVNGAVIEKYTTATAVVFEEQEEKFEVLSSVEIIQEQRAVFDDPEILPETEVQSSLSREDHPLSASNSATSSYDSQVSWTSEGSPFVRFKNRTSPLLSLSMSGGDLLQQSFSHQTHGYYSTVEVDIDPFAAEFRAGVDALKGGANAPTTTQAHVQEADYLSPRPKKEKQIPARAFQDPRFLDYINKLDHEPKVQDYITFQMGVIGDLIEKQYGDKLNQAMDDIFVELVKEKFVSWNTFEEVSRRLLVQGSRIQDGIMLIPCLARQLLDFVPHLGTVIGNYTEQMLDTYAQDNIMGMGGWSSLMESYSQDIVFTEYSPDSPDWQDPEAAVSHSSPWHGPRLQEPSQTPGSATTLPIRKKASVADLSLIPPQNPKPPRPFSLRRCVSVEVLVGEERDSPPPASRPMYSKSISIGSLDLATPTMPSPSLFYNKNLITDSINSPVTPSPRSPRRMCLNTLHEESYLYSRRSSTCSVIILGGQNSDSEEKSGFELVGVAGSESKTQVTSHQSTESLAASGEYMDHLYYTREGESDDTAEKAAPTSEAEHRDPDVPVRRTERRRSSAAEVVQPLAVVAAHLVVFGCWYFSGK